ncbi:hypothetical protein BKH43_00015 [Helicobacter sp. 13S00401-1]|uniref:hypothetical protein n=1 Tax=Helicobacter sp. 13S00401-1 TaxID=1905758 RepID=UPI000BA5A142|nr:hypothetical protein [Helicobacter sp. 13S00401-1]PAF51666.1 hypothetical protein BKH43_00015 [Helicobacter sp. 13S00401-1]
MRTRHKALSDLSYAVALLVVAFIYISASDIYPVLPPLLGVLFMIFHISFKRRGYYKVIAVFLILGFYELDKDLVFGILPLVFFVVRYFIALRLEAMANENLFFVCLYVVGIYVFYIAGMLLSNILFGTPNLGFKPILIYYFIIDLLVTLAYVKIRKL